MVEIKLELTALGEQRHEFGQITIKRSDRSWIWRNNRWEDPRFRVKVASGTVTNLETGETFEFENFEME